MRPIDAHVSTSDIRVYYRAVAPFYEREMRLRSDLEEWRAVARRLRPARVLDLGSGDGRAGEAIRDELPQATVVGVDLGVALLEDGRGGPFVLGDMRALPFRRASFDLVVAANDPFAHLLDERERLAAVKEAVGALRRHGRLIVDGLWLSTGDRRRAGDGGLLRDRTLGQGLVLREHWRALDGSVFETSYEYRRDGRRISEAHARVRAWDPREPAVREVSGRVFGSLDERSFTFAGDRLVVIIDADTVGAPEEASST